MPRVFVLDFQWIIASERFYRWVDVSAANDHDNIDLTFLNEDESPNDTALSYY